MINPMNEILITVGGYGAIYSAIMAHINEGDEVIIIEPAFDCYEAMVRFAGGVPVFVTLAPPDFQTAQGSVLSNDWKLDIDTLTLKFTAKTKLVIVNNPHNPIGKVFTSYELNAIGLLCEKNDCLLLMDEVYEWLVFPPQVHVRMASDPRFWDRTITIGSAGKTFSVTGWKCGWAYGPVHLIRPMQL
jgi:kynurenine--oxoglutarate transaminase/cysteine-S-conjugate beta-lyase/glutamine--phenylpyruvate transaminase